MKGTVVRTGAKAGKTLLRLLLLALLLLRAGIRRHRLLLIFLALLRLPTAFIRILTQARDPMAIRQTVLDLKKRAAFT